MYIIPQLYIHVLCDDVVIVSFRYPFNMLMIILSFIHLIIVMVTWKQPMTEDGKPNYASAVPDYIFEKKIVLLVSLVFAILHNIATFCVFVSYFITNHPTFPKFRTWRPKKFLISYEDKDEKKEDERKSNLEVKFFSIQTFWYILLLVCSLLGSLFYGYFFSFHLLHMAQFNQLVKRAIQAVSKNGRSLLWVFFYGLFFFYIYALISFAFYREIYSSNEGQYCTRMHECFVTIFHRGLIISLFEFLNVPEGKPFTYYLHKALFDVSFFIIITTIGLNIIFGIIVDTFSELRDNKWQVDNDMHTMCFICSRSSYDFEHEGDGFAKHVKEEHYLWSYLFFFIHLDETRPNDYTALELYVSRLLEKEDYGFFPINRALSLQHEEDSSEIQLQMLMTQVSYLVNKMKYEEALKEREQERRKQSEWEEKHRSSQKKIA
ncbi:hypothetical protein LSH36_861g02064 [Paralvinella palmiformis]|uniref:Ion transport domain-containing protein n=1 Tax=Paralvinella palmiformis TaxID=53620 RepID=A0AAD9IYC5_9ANNE|nr:hypothetical protein LSH36_861g02064 [Paralvinella palmiformis]